MNETILCIALAIFKESRAEPIAGKYAVAEVIHNRTKHPSFPSNHCAVVKQKNQFSWYRGGSIKPPKYELEAWKESVEVAKSFTNKKTNYAKGALFFNHKRLGVRFSRTHKTTIGQHVFF